MRRLAVALVLVIVVSACSKADSPTSSGEGISGEIGAATADGGDLGGGSSAATAGGGTATGTAGAAGGASAGAGGTTGGSGGALPSAPEARKTADGALNAYFDALGVENFALAHEVSTSGAQQMVRIRIGVATYNRQREGVTELRYSTRSFTAAAREATRVTYAGKAVLESTVSGPAGDPYSESAVFENPVVTLVNGEWRLSGFNYDGAPLVAHRTGATQQVGPVELRMEVAIAYGGAIGTVVDLVAESDHKVRIDDTAMEFDNGTIDPSRFGALVNGRPASVFFLFERKDANPTVWRAIVTIDEGTDKEVTKDVRLTIG